MKRYVICRETNQQFETLKEAADALGTTRFAIQQFFNRKIKHANGFTFRYGFDRRPLTQGRPDIAKPVQAIETGKLYPTVTTAARRFRVHPSAISNAIARNLKICGVSFRYVDLNESLPIRCEQTHRVFDTPTDAARDMGLRTDRILEQMRGNSASVGGYTFCMASAPLEMPKLMVTKTEAARLNRQIRDENPEVETKPTIRCTTTGETFFTVEDAARHFDLTAASINRVLDGKQPEVGNMVFAWL